MAGVCCQHSCKRIKGKEKNTVKNAHHVCEIISQIHYEVCLYSRGRFCCGERKVRKGMRWREGGGKL